MVQTTGQMGRGAGGSSSHSDTQELRTVLQPERADAVLTKRTHLRGEFHNLICDGQSWLIPYGTGGKLKALGPNPALPVVYPAQHLVSTLRQHGALA